MQGVKDVGTTELLAIKMGLNQGTRPNLTYLRVQCIAISKGVEQYLSPKPRWLKFHWLCLWTFDLWKLRMKQTNAWLQG